MPSAKEPQPKVDPAASQKPGLAAQTAHKVLLFYFGAVATVIEESYDLFGRLVEQGKAAEQEGRRRFSQIMDRRKAELEQAESDGLTQVREAIDRRTIPSKKDVEALDQQITRLTQQIDGLLAPK